MRPIIGEDQYSQRVASVAASFPVFATFNADVEVVVVDVVDVEVVLVGEVVVGVLLPPEHAARERQNPATTIAFFDIFLISLRYLI
jgi:hypothetical protein